MAICPKSVNKNEYLPDDTGSYRPERIKFKVVLFVAGVKYLGEVVP